MKLQHHSRRNFLALMAGAPLTQLLSPSVANAQADNSSSLPDKNMFNIKGTYINAAYTHPMSVGSYQEIQKFLNHRMNTQQEKTYDPYERKSVITNFAKLINASPDEIAMVPSTMVGENLILNGLSLPGSKAHIITDAMHFHGSLHLYNQLAKEGLNLTVLKPRDNKIDYTELANAIQNGTKLIAVSLVSATTGFRHDLKKICEIAHSKNVLVYADIIQAAGAVPIDVKDSGVDFCACATYKWLMGDFGIGFLYVRKDRLPLLKRTHIGYRQVKSSASHTLPFDLPGESAFESETKEDMSGYFEVGTFASEGINALRYSLDYLNRVGVDALHQYRKPMIDALQKEIPKRKDFIPLTPLDAVSPIVVFACKNAATSLTPKLEAADISISVYEHHIRISPSFYNTMNDIDKLIEVLKTVRG